MIRIEFWNGQTSNKPKYAQYGGLVTTKHNPCLWTNISEDDKPWRKVYKKAIEYIDDWKLKKIDDTELLHSLRYVAYGYSIDGNDKRFFDDTEVIWYGNLTIGHKPKLVYVNEISKEEFTLYFYFDSCWKIDVKYETQFYWTL
jgi:hypothetical protein